MTRRAARRVRRRRSQLALILAAAAVIVGVCLWRVARPWHSVISGAAAPSRVQQPGAPTTHGGEDFSAAERQGLEDVLKRRAAGPHQ